MNMERQILELKQQALASVERAARSGSVDEIRRFSDRLTEIECCEDALQNLKDRLSSLTRQKPPEIAQMRRSNGHEQSREPVSESVMARGKRDARNARQRFLEELEKRGLRCVPESNTVFRVGAHSRIIIPFANEQRQDRWFLGIPEGEDGRFCPYRAVICLCRDSAGEVKNFVIEQAVMQDIWSQMSRNSGDVKLTIVRDGSRYLLLVPGGIRLDLNPYRDRLDLID